LLKPDDDILLIMTQETFDSLPADFKGVMREVTREDFARWFIKEQHKSMLKY